MDQAKVTEVLGNVLNLIGLNPDQVNITIDEGENINISLKLPPETAGVFVGHRGDGLASLRMIFSLIMFQRFGIWPKLHLNVNDYQERREEALHDMARTAADKAISLQREIILPNLSSYERRIVHLFLETYPGVHTESRGEALYRQLTIIPDVA